jgi:chromosome segregation ATPase
MEPLDAATAQVLIDTMHQRLRDLGHTVGSLRAFTELHTNVQEEAELLSEAVALLTQVEARVTALLAVEQAKETHVAELDRQIAELRELKLNTESAYHLAMVQRVDDDIAFRRVSLMVPLDQELAEKRAELATLTYAAEQQALKLRAYAPTGGAA